jgi:hypothetical protein
VIFFAYIRILYYQSQEEAGSAEEQPASNKIDLNDKKGVDLFQLLLFYRVAQWLKKTYHEGLFLKCRYHFIKFLFAAMRKPL